VIGNRRAITFETFFAADRYLPRFNARCASFSARFCALVSASFFALAWAMPTTAPAA
jgi:hypothetical protein